MTTYVTRFPFVYGPIGAHKKKQSNIVSMGSTGQLTGVDSGGTLGIVMTVAVVAGIVLMLLLWKKAGQGLDDEEQTLLACSKEKVAVGESTEPTQTLLACSKEKVAVGECTEATEAEIQPDTGKEQDPTLTEESSDTGDVLFP